MSELKAVRRALLSVTDKAGLVEFARVLAHFGVELVSTGGTARTLREAGLPVRDISDLTGFPEMLDGRVKTLHPVVHGGLLHKRSDAGHVRAVQEHGIQPIDMVVVNLYAFEKTAAREDVAFQELIENIDIGGPSMLRSAAKNFEDVAVVSDPDDYYAIADEMASNNGSLSKETRWKLAKKAFTLTAAYDTAISTVLNGIHTAGETANRSVIGKSRAEETELPQTLEITAKQSTVLRYGENPHQKAALYVDGSGLGIASAEQLQGKELSYNNLVDLDACWALANDLSDTGVAIIKHTNPCGVGLGSSVADAYKRAFAADQVSAFGGVIGVNRKVDGEAAAEIAKLFVEAIVAPDFTPEALAAFSVKKNLRVLCIRPAHADKVLKQISGGYLLQDDDQIRINPDDLRVVTERQPSDEELAALQFAWTVCKHVKSNAIVYARMEKGFGQTVGVGAGQMSRVDAARFGAVKAVLPLQGSVAASDAFFPFADGLEVIADTGATAVIQPGGSVRDADVIAAADRLGLAMVFTGIRHFRHG